MSNLEKLLAEVREWDDARYSHAFVGQRARTLLPKLAEIVEVLQANAIHVSLDSCMLALERAEEIAGEVGK